MPRPKTTATRTFRATIKGARRANRIARVVSAPVRREARAVRIRAGANSIMKTISPLINTGVKALANRAQSYISGMGDYDISGITQNSLLGKMSPTVPQFSNATISGGVRVVHREYIKDILSSQLFNNEIFPINPGLPSSFPWLSRIAQNFEQYRIHGMIYEFKSGSSDSLNSTNTALGYVIGAVEYNTLNPGYANKLEMENALFCSSTKPSLGMITAVECQPIQTPVSVMYVRTGFESTAVYDRRLFDLGIFNIATVGMQADGANLGELWVSYDIELYKTRFLEPGSTIPTYSITFFNPSSYNLLFSNAPITETNTMGLLAVQSFDVPTQIAQVQFTIPPGRKGHYLLNYELLGINAQSASFTRPPQGALFGNFANITETLTYPNTEFKSNTVVHHALSYNNQDNFAVQTPSSKSQFIAFTFTIDDNNLSSSFTFQMSKIQIDAMVMSYGLSGDYQGGVCYITQVNPCLCGN
jgi:Viral coat protein (S domain).